MASASSLHMQRVWQAARPPTHSPMPASAVASALTKLGSRAATAGIVDDGWMEVAVLRGAAAVGCCRCCCQSTSSPSCHLLLLLLLAGPGLLLADWLSNAPSARTAAAANAEGGSDASMAAAVAASVVAVGVPGLVAAPCWPSLLLLLAVVGRKPPWPCSSDETLTAELRSVALKGEDAPGAGDSSRLPRSRELCAPCREGRWSSAKGEPPSSCRGRWRSEAARLAAGTEGRRACCWIQGWRSSSAMLGRLRALCRKEWAGSQVGAAWLGRQVSWAVQHASCFGKKRLCIHLIA